MSEAPGLKEFCSIFTGNAGFYVKHQPPFTKDETTGKVKGSWVGIAKSRDKEILPVTPDKYKEHLEGGDGLALEPLCADHKCFFGVIDIDVPDYNYTYLIQKLHQHGLKFAPFVSKSAGLHIYFFWQNPEKGSDTIDFLNRVVDTFGLNKLFTSGKGKSKVEVFPKHAVIEPGAQGSCIFLPYYNVAGGKCHQKLISSEGKLLKFSSAITAIENAFTSVSEMSKVMDSLPYSDAPFCVQMISLTGALGEGDGRNDYLFSAGVYLKKKYKEGFLDELMKINSSLEAPMTDDEVEATYTSVMSKEYKYKCKSGPCAEYCDTKLCKMREYGVGKDKGNQFTGFACWGEISRIMAEEPYYEWEVQVDEDGPFKKIRIDSEADLMNQTIVARSCIRYLNRAPMVVKPNSWLDTVNKSLEGIENRIIEIARATDTTEMSALRGYFIRFLTHKQMQNGLPYLVGLGQVYHEDGNYYFTTEGFKDYLRIQKFNTNRMNLREELIRFGCTEGSVSYKVSSGEKTIQCWKKQKDEDIEQVGTFYDDVEEADKIVLQDSRLNKVDSEDVYSMGAEEEDDEEHKF